MSARPALDPELADGLEGMPPMVFSEETLTSMRQLGGFGAVDCPDDLVRTDLEVGPGGSVALTLYRPRAAVGALPCMLWMHGGGLIIGNRHINDATLIGWSRDFQAVLATVEYRLAPEAPYPAALDDCLIALEHLAAQAGPLGIDPARLGVGGQSSGGGLAAALTLRARDESGPAIAFQYLEYPMLDDRQQTPSSRRDGLAMWSREANAFGWSCYLGELHGTEHITGYAAPARAADLTGLPPAYLCVGTADGFRDEVLDYATRLTASDVLVELHVYAGAPHAFQLFGDSEVGKCGIRDSDSWLRRQLAPGSGGSSGAAVVQITTG